MAFDSGWGRDRFRTDFMRKSYSIIFRLFDANYD